MRKKQSSFLPRTLKIGAHQVDVQVVDSWPEGDLDMLGQAFPERGVIYVRAGLPETQAFRVLIHEAMHFMNGTMSHELLDSLAEQIAQFLLDNKLS